MQRDKPINIHCFDKEVGKIGFDENRKVSFFQYNPSFLQEGLYTNLFPFIIKRIALTQVFNKFQSETFRGLPPMIADSLPDAFGNTIFNAWMQRTGRDARKLSVIDQLAYVGRRGMGALEYHPVHTLHATNAIDLEKILAIVEEVLLQKKETVGTSLSSEALMNIFKIGTSAGGARPKVLVSQHQVSGQLIPGDLDFSNEYKHYLVKLGVEEHLTYSREVVEFSYYQAALYAGIDMMPAVLIDGKHFAALRFDRQDGEKKHVLTATGLTGFDFKDTSASSYENLFSLALRLKVPHKDIDELFRRMVFNWVFANHDDHLKNHSFIYDKNHDSWRLAPAYDLTYSLNPELNFSKVARALSINGKRIDISEADLLLLAENFTVKNPRSIFDSVRSAATQWREYARELGIPERIVALMWQNFKE